MAKDKRVKKPGTIFGRPEKYDKKVEALALVEWSKTDEAFTLYEFASDRGYPQHYMDGWANEDEDFSLAMDIANSNIANRLFKGSTKNKFNAAFVAKFIGMYSKRMKRHMREEKEAAKQDQIDSLAVALRYAARGDAFEDHLKRKIEEGNAKQEKASE